MKSILLFCLIVVIPTFTTWGQTSSTFWNKEDIDIIMNKTKVRWIKLTGDYVDSALHDTRSKYVLNYKIKSAEVMRNNKLAKFLTPLLQCADHDSIPRCTFLPQYCIEIHSKQGKLYLMCCMSETCRGFSQVVKINNISGKEATKYVNADDILVIP